MSAPWEGDYQPMLFGGKCEKGEEKEGNVKEKEEKRKIKRKLKLKEENKRKREKNKAKNGVE